jgi:FkbM family methyltransferase
MGGVTLSVILLMLLLMATPPPPPSVPTPPLPANAWLETIFGSQLDKTKSWTLWLYEDPVTLKTLVLPNEPQMLRAEPNMVRLFNQLTCHKAELFVDVGANSGFYALLAQLRGCRVVAVEMQPSCVAMLRFAQRANLLDATGIELIQRPVMTKDGEALMIDTSQRCEGMLSIFWRGHQEMRSISLDTLLLPKGPIAMLKMDIEGFETHALAGAQRLIAERRVGAFLVEATWWPNVLQPVVRAYEEMAFIFDHGYTARCIGAPPVWDAEWTSAAAWIEYGASPAASKPLEGDPERRHVSTCSEYLFCRVPCSVTL